MEKKARAPCPWRYSVGEAGRQGMRSAQVSRIRDAIGCEQCRTGLIRLSLLRIASARGRRRAFDIFLQSHAGAVRRGTGGHVHLISNATPLCAAETNSET